MKDDIARHRASLTAVRGISRRPFLLGIAVLAVAAAALLYRRQEVAPHPGRGTPWTVLQDLESAHRTDADLDSPLLIDRAEGSGYLALGLPTGDPNLPRTWLLLNEHLVDHSEGPPKSVPASLRFHVTCAYVETLLSTHAVDPPVVGLLHRRCSR
jgi:hypothetical protein